MSASATTQVFPSFAEVYQGLASQIGMLRQMAPQPTKSEEKRLQGAIDTLIADTNADEAVWLESCIHCGQCTTACHYFQSMQDAKYAPMRKMDLYRRVYQREVSPMRWWHRLVTKPVKLSDFEEAKELIYDSCTECGRCTMVCPMGIDTASLVHHMRSAMVAAELVPPELAALRMEQKYQGTVFGSSPEKLKGMVDTIRERTGVEIPLDKESAEVMVLSSAVDLVANGNGLLATARIMNHIGVDWTICSDGFESANFGLLSGDMTLWKQQADPIVAAAQRVKAKTVVIAECGHAYPALRWNPMLRSGALPFEMMYMSEFLGKQAKAGKLRLKPLNQKVTFHDPCKTGRRGGAFDEPRAVLKAMDADLVEMPNNKEYNWCCGGGAGIFLLEDATRLRDESFKIKIREVNETGAESVVVSCASCRLNFESGRQKNHWDKRVESLVELTAAHLIDDDASAAATGAAATSAQGAAQ